MAVSWQNLDPAGLEGPFSEGLDRDEAPYASFEPGESPFAEAAPGTWSEGSWSEAMPSFEGEGFPSGVVLQPAQGATGPGQEHWDPNGVGLPLLGTPPSTHAIRLSASFTVGELVRSGGRASSVARISPALVRVLQAIRDHAGKPIRITSGYRSFARNGAVYAARNQKATKSRHSSGQAADITIAGMSGVAIAKLAIDAAGTDLAIGIGRADIHVDVRGTFTIWSYLPGAAGAAAIAEVRAHRERRLRGMAPIPAPTRTTPPAPMPPIPTPVGPIPTPVGPVGDRLVVEQHPLLRGHRGTPPDLVLRWSRVSGPGEVDVVVHFHGYSGKQAGMRIDRDKEPASGLDLSGRARPTLALLPRGNYFGGRSGSGYDFPALVRPGALSELIRDGLARLSQATGHQVTLGRLILTGHSGGGAPVTAIVALTDPDEVHVFDGMYGSGSNIVRWAKQRIEREQANPSVIPPAMRIIYRPGTGTQANSEAVARGLRASLPAGSSLARSFRVDATRVVHDAIPGRFGPALLADAAADLSDARTFNETAEWQGSSSETYETALTSEAGSEHLEWLDPTTEAFGAQWTTSEDFGAQWTTSEADHELPSSEGPSGEGPYSESTYGEGPYSEGPYSEGPYSEGPYGEAGAGEQPHGEGPLGEQWFAEGVSPEAGIGEWQETGEGPVGEWQPAEAGQTGEWQETGEGPVGEWQPAETGQTGEWQETGEGPLGEELDTGEQGYEAGASSGAELSTETALDAWGEGPSEAEWNSLVGDTPAAGGEAGDRPVLESLLESEVGAGSGLADRVKGVAAFVLGGTLRRGDSGAGVAALQRAMVTLGMDVSVDGAFGRNTERAVRYFQAGRGITEDGVVGHVTKAALAGALGGVAPSPTPAPPVPPPSPSTTGVCSTIALVAEQEFARWHPASGDIRETDSAAVSLLTRYYREGVGQTVTAGQLQNEDWQKAHPWSAVFVSFVMREAGATGFRSATAHQDYIAAARSNRLAGLTTNPFWLYRPTEIAPQVGDVICWERDNSGATFENIGNTGVRRKTHGDIVTQVRPNGVRVIGGNVNQNVDTKRPVILTQPDGRLALTGKQARIFAIVSCRGAATGGGGGGTTPLPQPPTLIPQPSAPTPNVPGKKLTPREFIATYGPAARASQARSGVPALVILGQAALESGWGAKAPRFNFFGIKAKATDPEDRRQLLVTREVYRDGNRTGPNILAVKQRPDGKFDYTVRAWFRAYPDVNTAFDDHARVLRLPRYANAFTVVSDPYAFATEVARGGYATDPAYAPSLHGVMRTIQAAGGP